MKRLCRNTDSLCFCGPGMLACVTLIFPYLWIGPRLGDISLSAGSG